MLVLVCGLVASSIALADEEKPAPEAPAGATETTEPAEAAEPEAAETEAADAEAAPEAVAEAEEPEEVEEEEEEESALAEYGASVGNRFLMGLDSVLTAPADPVMSAVQPDKEFDDLPLSIVLKWPVGFVQGALLMGHRASSGVLDMVFAALTPMKMLSPEPRFQIFPNVEHEEY
jgi:hypothetical protein